MMSASSFFGSVGVGGTVGSYVITCGLEVAWKGWLWGLRRLVGGCTWEVVIGRLLQGGCYREVITASL